MGEQMRSVVFGPTVQIVDTNHVRPRFSIRSQMCGPKKPTVRATGTRFLFEIDPVRIPLFATIDVLRSFCPDKRLTHSSIR